MRQRFIGWVCSVIMLVLISISATSTEAQFGVRALVVNEFSNIRISPAIGAPVIDTVSAGYVYEIVEAKSGDGQWIRVQFNGTQGWVNLIPLIVLEGDVNALPVADPRTIPYGGFDAPRAGTTTQQGQILAAATDGLRVRAGPSTAYPTIANINFNEQFTILGRYGNLAWYQVNYENTLGWVSANFVEIRSGDVTTVPVDGIIADEPPLSAESFDDYVAALNFLLDRVNIAQGLLNDIRGSWTDAALNGRAVCQAYPSRPSDANLPVPLIAANFETLDPILRDFNDAMFNIRRAIDLFIEVCNQPGTANPVGQATTQGALGVVNLADQQLASLRNRLNDLIPETLVGIDECLLVYNGRAEILPVIQIGTIYVDEFTLRENARGYCIQAVADQILNIQTLPLPNSDLEIFVAISPLDNPTAFLTLGQSFIGQFNKIGPIPIPETKTYVVLMADLGGFDELGEPRPPVGNYAFAVLDQTFGDDGRTLAYDELTDSVVFQAAEVTTVETGGPQPVTDVCPSTGFQCFDLTSCSEVQACVVAGNLTLDSNNDGIPCGPGDQNLPGGVPLCN